MNLYLLSVFIFFLGSVVGWILELVYRRILHGKLVNPGFLVGPYLPIYGFGLLSLTILHILLTRLNLYPVVIILLMGIVMTLIELIGGLFALSQKVRLWDYSKNWLNFKGIICPYYSAMWLFIGTIYYFFLYDPLIYAVNWFNENISFSYVIGILSGFLIIDFVYSTKLYIKIRKYAKENNVTVMYEKLKIHIKDVQKNAKEKYSFLFPFTQTKKLIDYLGSYIDKK